MAIGTDQEIFTGEKKPKKPGRGDRLNRELGYKLLKARYSTQHIRRVLGCSARSVRLMRQELREAGEIEETEKTAEMDRLGLDFDKECERAVGISFAAWLKSKRKDHRTIFNFSKMVWEKIWTKPSLVMVRDRDQIIGDQLAMKFLEMFGEDYKRIRHRKKRIRQLFTFLGRQDINDRYLTMTKSRDPEPIREIPELTLIEFPKMIDEALNMVRHRFGAEYETALKFKIVTQMRTGNVAEGRELMGMTCGTSTGTWITMTDPDEFRGQILAKGRERWVVQWIPTEVRRQLWEVYQKRETGEHLFSMTDQELRDAWTEVTTDHEGLRPLHLHDLRKISVTWLWAMGVDLSIATELNVGWKDLNTAKRFYLRNQEILKKTSRIAYRENIPEWFKEGLDEYLPY